MAEGYTTMEAIAEETSKKLIVIGNNVYNVTDYAASHPGGKYLLINNHGKDMTEKFKKVGHSKKALSILETLKYAALKDKTQEDLNLIPNWRKLFTHEDKFFIHKTLGIACLTHFFYRLVLCRFTTSHLSEIFSYNIWTMILCGMHIVLSGSSFLFHVPRERVNGSPQIWMEFRGHSFLFALRSYLCILAELYFSVPYSLYLKIIFIYLTMLGADWVTDNYRELSNTSTTRTMPYWEGAKVEKFFKTFYMVAQVHATLLCTCGILHSFCLLLPIQIAPFLMTLVRKQLISSKTYHFVYAGSLLYNYLIFINFSGSVDPDDFVLFSVFIALFSFLRRRFNLNKYMLWSVIFAGLTAKKIGLYSFSF